MFVFVLAQSTAQVRERYLHRGFGDLRAQFRPVDNFTILALEHGVMIARKRTLVRKVRNLRPIYIVHCVARTLSVAIALSDPRGSLSMRVDESLGWWVRAVVLPLMSNQLRSSTA
jgi:hypothetical protein